ncbi:p53-like transcription factor [Trichoderma citrinoviride]|uniref:p53-like transcription factor n=1 Tax=Trichoderma citrinoviride TaxID=58853 RepID=A0A2T4B6Y7_9HYPO|nr:p53-like transcription factor [Trichoderma citrinoviride]PTB65094.1 p53-like transcription factor [Trichoderma citrinoviride]
MRRIHCDGTTTNIWPCRACQAARFHCEPPGGSLPPDSLSQSFYHSPEPSQSFIRESLPFLDVTTLGTLFYATSRVETKVDLHGIIDNVFFLANGEWTSYQPNYLSCRCSYSLSSPDSDSDKIKLKPEFSTHSFDVKGFAVSISAIECDCKPYESCVEIVQHLARGEDGPSTRAPAKVKLRPRNHQFSITGVTTASHRLRASEYTFDQLEVKTATARDGREPRGQTYFQLVLELWADLGSQYSARFMKVAYKKSVTVTLGGLVPRPINFPSSNAHMKPSAGTDEQLSPMQPPLPTTRELQRRLPHRGFISWAKKMCRPRLRPGYRRIEWTCDCGVDLYGDFSQEEPSDLDALEASLRSPPETTSPATDSTDAERVEDTPTGTPQSNFSWNTGRTASPTFTDASSVDLHAKYLALCVNTGGMYKKLAEIDTSRIKSDSEVFHQMKKAYLEHRGLRSRLSFLVKPVTVEFVRFTLWNLRHGYISITDRPKSMPPKSSIDYDFVPPPMTPEVFIHYLEHGDDDLSPNRHTWLPRLPQRLNGKVLHCGEAAEGWGIHVVEGPNRLAVFWIVMATVFASVLASVLWASLMGDIQGGTGLGALIMALPGVIMAAFLFRLEATPRDM